ncbi:hypothetical protein SeMB42_g00749 [Synchytrium endobioticum]|uniref:XPG-I domain-containing protein n=1 Tax=Synchytrium endobioticum TaxID=286115 RepID=A0A507DQG5_9FUNG|nr:hypothetical protein SeMB42_g00749 [Synchytrium endobioticum]
MLYNKASESVTTPPSTSMGIKYLWKYLTSLNVVKEKLGSVDSKLLFGLTGNAAPKKLKSIFPDDRTVFVTDGDRASAKSGTTMKRHWEWCKVVDELDKVAASMKQAADDGRKRMPKSFYQKLDRLTRRSFLVNDDVKTGLAAALEAEFKVEKAPGEADVYIGRVATDLDIVVSGDSDVFCYRNVKAMSLALRKMRLNADDLVVLAVVSGNDYKIKEKGDFSKEDMLKNYLQLCQSDRNFDKNTPMKRKADEGGTSRGGPSKSRKTIGGILREKPQEIDLRVVYVKLLHCACLLCCGC